MTKTYGIKALRPLLDLTEEIPPLIASYDPYGDDSEPWIVRYIIDKSGFWLQVNEAYGSGVATRSALSKSAFEEVTGFVKDDLESIHVDGVGCRYGLPGGKPILPLPFTVAELLAFDRATGVVLEAIEQTDEWLAELEQRNPDAAELAKIVLCGERPSAESTDYKTHEDALISISADFTGSAEASPVRQINGKRWTPEFCDEVTAYRNVHGTKAAASKYGVTAARIRQMLPGQKSKADGYSAFTYHTK